MRRTEIQRLVAAVLLVVALAACGDQPLQGMGQRSEGWIGPIAENVQFLPADDGRISTP
jgi:hypothetical protein